MGCAFLFSNAKVWNGVDFLRRNICMLMKGVLSIEVLLSQ